MIGAEPVDFGRTGVSWGEAIARLGRNDYPGVLVRNWYQLAEDERLVGLEQAWCMTEWPLRHATADLWTSLFREVLEPGYEDERGGGPVDAYLHDHWLNDAGTLPETITLFRGFGDVRGARGMSWTDDLDRAQWFADRVSMFYPTVDRHERGHHRGTVVAAVVRRDAVLARFEGRSENEWVLDPAELPAQLHAVTPLEEPDANE